MYMCNVFKKYGKIIFLFMIVFIGSFFSINKVEAATALNSCAINTSGDYYLNSSYTCDTFRVRAKNVTIDLNGKTLEIKQQFIINSDMSLTINDSKGTGTVKLISSSGSRISLFYVHKNATLTINGGNYYNYASAGAIFGVAGKLIVNGGYAYMSEDDSSYGSFSTRDPIVNIAPYSNGSCTYGSVVFNGGYFENRAKSGIVGGRGDVKCRASMTNITFTKNFKFSVKKELLTSTRSSVNYYDITYYFDNSTISDLKPESYIYGV